MSKYIRELDKLEIVQKSERIALQRRHLEQQIALCSRYGDPCFLKEKYQAALDKMFKVQGGK